MGPIEISEYYNAAKCRAVVVKNRDNYSIEYYDANGLYLQTEKFENVHLMYVEDAAENWANGIKKVIK